MARKKKTEEAKRFPKATMRDFEVILEPVITEKTMSLVLLLYGILQQIFKL